MSDEIFHEGTSKRFKDFVNEYEQLLRSRIAFNRSEECPIKEYRSALGALDPVSINPIKVYVNVTLLEEEGFPKESHEVIAAHEVLHKWLETMMFPTTACDKEIPQGSIEKRIGGQLHSMIHHLVIDNKLAMYDFNVSGVNEWHAKKYLSRLQEIESMECYPGEPMFIREVLFYVGGCYRYSSAVMSKAKEILETKNPKLIYVGERCKSLVDKVECKEPSGALQAMINLRNKLGLKERKIMIYDPKANQAY